MGDPGTAPGLCDPQAHTHSCLALTHSLSGIFISVTEFCSDTAASSLTVLLYPSPSHPATTICSQHMPRKGDKAADVLRGFLKCSIIMQELRKSLLETPFALLIPGTFGKPS